jgi:CheY-like chemotaxis protein
MNDIVLYIDDSPDNLVLVERLLKRGRPDIKLHTAGTGRDGLKAAADTQPTLILLDNRLPDTNGKQVLGQLAASPATAAIPVIVFSGDCGRADVEDLLAAGAVEFLAKPFDINQFLAVIARYLG